MFVGQWVDLEIIKRRFQLSEKNWSIGFYEELSPGVRLIGLNSKEVVFERDEDSLVVINFKNQIIERDN